MLNVERNRALAFMLFIIPALLFVGLAVTVTSVALAQEQGGQQPPAAQENPQQPPGQPSQPDQGQPPPQDNPRFEVDIDVHEEPVWYGQWWVWALGIAVFLVVIVALTNRGQSA